MIQQSSNNPIILRFLPSFFTITWNLLYFHEFLLSFDLFPYINLFLFHYLSFYHTFSHNLFIFFLISIFEFLLNFFSFINTSQLYLNQINVIMMTITKLIFLSFINIYEFTLTFYLQYLYSYNQKLMITSFMIHLI